MKKPAPPVPKPVLKTARCLARMLAAVMEEMEDREWAQKAREAEQEGLATPEESEALMRDLRRKYG